MSLTIKQIEEEAISLNKKENNEKKIIVKQIISIIKDDLKDSGYIDHSNYVNGFLPKNATRKYVKIYEHKKEIYIPKLLVCNDKTLEHFSDSSGCFKTSFLSKNGLYLDFCSFSSYYQHSLLILKLILIQLNENRE